MIVADVHNHTNASHGKASVGEMYAAAKDRGLAVYGFSEHSPRPEAYSYPVEYREHLRQNFVCYASEVMQLRALSGSPKVLLAAHPDIIKLSSVDVFHQGLAMPESLALISVALTAIRDNGLVMEISSAGLRKPCNEIYPHPAIMKLASDLGVQISFGSDAHCPNTPAYAFDQLEAYARSYGYTSSVIFENRTPRAFGF